MKKWLQDIINLLYPPICHVCGSPLASHEKFLCAHCLQALPRTGYHRNPRNPMEQRFAGQFPFLSATGHFFYSRDSSLAQLFQDMKYRGFYEIGRYLGNVAASELFISGYFNSIECIVPVPMHYLKKASRGYNQAELIAKGLSEVTGIPTINALKMKRQRMTQTALSRIERLNNSENLFKVKNNYILHNKSILLVDDVCTTGSTLGSAAKAITDNFPTATLSIFSLGVTF